MSASIPHGWKEFRLDELADIERRIVDSTNIENGAIYIGLEHITGDGEFTNIRPVQNGQIASSKYKFDDKHILYGKLRPYLRKIALPSFAGVCSTDIVPIRVKPGRAERTYLFYYLRRPQMVSLAEARSAGANLPRISPSALEEFPILAPSNVAEQCRIAAILEKADTIRRQRRQAIGETDSLLRAAFLDMFGDPATNARSFEICAVERVLSRIRSGTQSGPFGSALKKEEYVPDGIPVWGIDNVENNRFRPDARLFITPSKFEQLKRYDVQHGEILISRAGTVGRICIAEPETDKSLINTNLVRISLNSQAMRPEYFVTLFTSFPDRLSRLRANKKQNSFSFLNPAALRTIQIPRAPMELQKTFAKIYWSVRRARELSESGRSADEQLFGSLTQRGFSGEL
jgi:type I restriction enzyme S subunit